MFKIFQNFFFAAKWRTLIFWKKLKFFSDPLRKLFVIRLRFGQWIRLEQVAASFKLKTIIQEDYPDQNLFSCKRFVSHNIFVQTTNLTTYRLRRTNLFRSLSKKWQTFLYPFHFAEIRWKEKNLLYMHRAKIYFVTRQMFSIKSRILHVFYKRN